jgi:hypothetical protein
MNFDPSAAIMRALMVTRPGAAAGGQQMAAGAPAKGFQGAEGGMPQGGDGGQPTIMGRPDSEAAGAPAKGFQPMEGGQQPPPSYMQTQGYSQPQTQGYSQPQTQSAPPADMYARLAQNIQMAQPAYRAYQPTDFRAAPRQQYQFDPATDPSRIVLAKLAERAAKDKADAEAKAQATEPPPYDPYFAGGGHSGQDSP